MNVLDGTFLAIFSKGPNFFVKMVDSSLENVRGWNLRKKTGLMLWGSKQVHVTRTGSKTAFSLNLGGLPLHKCTKTTFDLEDGRFRT